MNTIDYLPMVSHDFWENTPSTKIALKEHDELFRNGKCFISILEKYKPGVNFCRFNNYYMIKGEFDPEFVKEMRQADKDLLIHFECDDESDNIIFNIVTMSGMKYFLDVLQKYIPR